MGLYVLTAISLAGMAPLQDFNADTAMADAFAAADMDFVSIIIYMCAFFGITAACFTNLLSQPKNLQAQANDGLLPAIFARLNPSTGVPVVGSWICIFFMSIPAFMLDLEQITKVISCGNLLTYSFVTACGVALRFRERDTQATMRASGELWVWAYLVTSFLTALSIMK